MHLLGHYCPERLCSTVASCLMTTVEHSSAHRLLSAGLPMHLAEGVGHLSAHYSALPSHYSEAGSSAGSTGSCSASGSGRVGRSELDPDSAAGFAD